MAYPIRTSEPLSSIGSERFGPISKGHRGGDSVNSSGHCVLPPHTRQIFMATATPGAVKSISSRQACLSRPGRRESGPPPAADRVPRYGFYNQSRKIPMMRSAQFSDHTRIDYAAASLERGSRKTCL
jgi:hypothetical protein